EDLSIQPDTPATPIRTREVHEKQFPASFSFLLRLLVIRQPARLRGSGANTKDRDERRGQKDRAERFHAAVSRSFARFARTAASEISRYTVSPATERRANESKKRAYLMCPETSFVISNMLTWLLPLKTG